MLCHDDVFHIEGSCVSMWKDGGRRTYDCKKGYDWPAIRRAVFDRDEVLRAERRAHKEEKQAL